MTEWPTSTGTTPGQRRQRRRNVITYISTILLLQVPAFLAHAAWYQHVAIAIGWLVPVVIIGPHTAPMMGYFIRHMWRADFPFGMRYSNGNQVRNHLQSLSVEEQLAFPVRAEFNMIPGKDLKLRVVLRDDKNRLFYPMVSDHNALVDLMSEEGAISLLPRSAYVDLPAPVWSNHERRKQDAARLARIARAKKLRLP